MLDHHGGGGDMVIPIERRLRLCDRALVECGEELDRVDLAVPDVDIHLLHQKEFLERRHLARLDEA